MRLHDRDALTNVNRSEDHKKGESFVLRELRYAQQVRKPIIPIMVQQTDVPIELIGGQYIDFTDRSDRDADWLIERICDEIGIQNPAQWREEQQREAERLRAEAAERAYQEEQLRAQQEAERKGQEQQEQQRREESRRLEAADVIARARQRNEEIRTDRQPAEVAESVFEVKQPLQAPVNTPTRSQPQSENLTAEKVMMNLIANACCVAARGTIMTT